MLRARPRPISALPMLSLVPILAIVLAALAAGGRDAAAQPPDPALRKACQLARSEDPAKRAQGMETLIAAGAEGQALLRPILERTLARQVTTLKGLMKSPGGKKLRHLATTRLEEARKAALAVIYDKAIYPDENHGAVGQPRVDEVVGAVRALWATPVTTLRKEVASVDAFLTDLEVTYRFLAAAGVTVPPEFPDFRAALTYLDKRADVPSVDAGSTLSRRTEQVRDAFRQVGSEAQPGELEVVRLLNDYRRMMGRLPVAPHLLLMRASRKHSQEMEDLRYFSHTSPTAGYRTPSMRAAKEGYGGGCAENIARAGTAAGAHNGWYNSSGHHRNMLGRHRVIGLGRSKGGGFWTQMFGSGGLPGGKKTAEPNKWLTYRQRARSAAGQGLRAHHDLAAWCRDQGLYRAMEEQARQVLARRADDEPTRRLLGEQRSNGAWRHPVDQEAAAAAAAAAKVKVLKEHLKSDDAYVRLRAVRALAMLFEPAAEKVIVRALNDPHPDVRIEATLGLMIGIGNSVERSLKSRMKDKSPRVRHFAAAALYRRGNAAGIRGLLKDAVEGDDLVRASAGQALRFLAHQDFGYIWNAERPAREAAMARALTWFTAQTDGPAIPR